MKMAFANTFLISQGYPAINQRKLVSSTIKLIEKLTETFTSYEVDFRQYEKTINAQVQEFESDYMTWAKYNSLTDIEQVPDQTKFV